MAAARLPAMAARSNAVARRRCAWAGDDPLMVAYHDEEWGRPSRDDHHLSICYAFMQATGMVDHHQRDCFRCREQA